MTTLLLVRHGESEANRDAFFAGDLDVELLDKGVQQAKKTARYITDNYKLDKAYASDLKRAMETGKYITEHACINVIPDKSLREICAGSWRGVKFSELNLLFSEDYNVWMNDIGNAKCTNGESVAQLAQRVKNRLTEIAIENDSKTVLIVTHATPIRAMQCLVERGDLNEMKNVPWVSNASVSVLEYNKGNWNFPQKSYDKHLSGLKTTFPKNI